MNISKVRSEFIDYFRDLGFQPHSASSLVPDNDPTVLFTTAGMQQFRDYYIFPQDAPASRVVTSQPVIRTTDIVEVGDDTHLTSFEMLGNFSFGASSSNELKKTAIDEAWQFLTSRLKISSSRLAVTFFSGDELTPADEFSRQHWQRLGLEARGESRSENFWGPTGSEGPCGPTTEIYLDGIEIWNLVFNEYEYKNKKFNLLKTPGLDTGAGLERLAATLQGKSSIWEIEPFSIWTKALSRLETRNRRVVVDHLRAMIFITSTGLKPGKKGRESILRRLIRTASFHLRAQSPETVRQVIGQIYDFYQVNYNLSSQTEVMSVFEDEAVIFYKNLTKADSYLRKNKDRLLAMNLDEITKEAFYLYESFGFPRELLFEFFKDWQLNLNDQEFERLFTLHQEKSRAGLEKQFTGGLVDHEVETIAHHTAHHLLLAALKKLLGSQIVQRGSNITAERLRLDFAFQRALTKTELESVESLVNKVIDQDLPVVREEMGKQEALNSGAEAEFGQKYGDRVSVYSIGDFSRELCGGPHVTRTSQLGRFKILKEEASSQGVRRIKAKLDR